MTGIYAGLLGLDARAILLFLRLRIQKKTISPKIRAPPTEHPAAIPSIAAAESPPPDDEGALLTGPPDGLPEALGDPDEAAPSDTSPELARIAVDAPPIVLPIAVM